MKKRYILPACLILIGLVAAVLACIHGFSTISEAQASQIALDYVKAEKKANVDGDYKINEIVLTYDMESLIAGTQRWIAWTIGPKEYWTWLYINAYTGKVDKTDYGWKEWTWPTDIPPGSQLVSFVLVIPYLFMIAFAFLYHKKLVFRILFWVSPAIIGVLYIISEFIMGLIRLFFPT
jgi:hypothetical protein